jgi:hypothetical protein
MKWVAGVTAQWKLEWLKYISCVLLQRHRRNMQEYLFFIAQLVENSMRNKWNGRWGVIVVPSSVLSKLLLLMVRTTTAVVVLLHFRNKCQGRQDRAAGITRTSQSGGWQSQNEPFVLMRW